MLEAEQQQWYCINLTLLIRSDQARNTQVKTCAWVSLVLVQIWKLNIEYDMLPGVVGYINCLGRELLFYCFHFFLLTYYMFWVLLDSNLILLFVQITSFSPMRTWYCETLASTT